MNLYEYTLCLMNILCSLYVIYNKTSTLEQYMYVPGSIQGRGVPIVFRRSLLVRSWSGRVEFGVKNNDTFPHAG